jgi:hypothetical protein
MNFTNQFEIPDFLNGLSYDEEDISMRMVKVKVDVLLAKLEENCKTHIETFEKACVGYRKAMVDTLEKMLSAAKQGKHVEHYIHLTQPMNQTKDYERAIGMLKMHTEPEIEITSAEYAMYVQDEWQWKQQFTTTNSAYIQGQQ